MDTKAQVIKILEQGEGTESQRLKEAFDVVYASRKKGYYEGSDYQESHAYLYGHSLSSSKFFIHASDAEKKNIFDLWIDESVKRSENEAPESILNLQGLVDHLKYISTDSDRIKCAEKLSQASEKLPLVVCIDCNKKIIESLYHQYIDWGHYGKKPEGKWYGQGLLINKLNDYDAADIVAMDDVMESCLTKIGVHNTEEEVESIVQEERRKRRRHAVGNMMAENGLDLGAMPHEQFETCFKVMKDALINS